LDDHFPAHELEEVGDRSLAAVEAWVGYLDRQVADQLESLGASGFCPGYAAFFWLHILHNAVTTRLHEIQRAIEANRPSEVMYFTTASYEAGEPHRLDFQGESLYAKLIPIYAASIGMHSRSLGSTAWYHETLGLGSKKLVRKGIGQAARSAKTLLASLPRRVMSRDRGTVCLLDPSLAAAVIALTGYQAVWWRAAAGKAYWLTSARLPQSIRTESLDSTRVLRGRLGTFWENLSADQSFRQHFREGEIDFFHVVSSRVRHLVIATIPRTFELYVAALQQLRRWHIDVVLSQNLGDTTGRVVAQAARQLDIPVVVHDHGSTGYFNFPLDRHMDSAVADFRLVWGEGVRASVSRRYPNGAIPVAVGGVPLDQVRRRLTMGQSAKQRLCKRLGLQLAKPIVIYAPTLMSANNRYLLRLQPTDCELYRRQRLIVEVFRDFPDVQCLVKLHPSPLYPLSPIKEWVHDLPNALCVTEPALPEAIAIGDLLLTDSPTTTLLEMLMSDKRILVCNNGPMEFEPSAVELLRRRAVFVETAEELAEQLRDHLAASRFGEAPNLDQSFLRAFGTHLNDGRSGLRAMEALRVIMRGAPPASLSRLTSESGGAYPSRSAE
jgi:hypothetical protein